MWMKVLELPNLLVDYVCMLTDDSLGRNIIIFYSDADGNTLPVSFANTGITWAYKVFICGRSRNPFEVASIGFASIRLFKHTIFNAKCLVSGFSTSWLYLGNVFRVKWNLL